ncbi:cytochrome P450 [Lentithecium fluviatile CBS 122367]|uniref:Cytochrome P450 n=1 Tax=Lentithecium fluviatile CBS 122367 TaxID=1168545 RepID=A0A6G1J4M3_9PLEO|nr:cytochrome P450 [Lentithecium fluviatile CBS 122367]
MVLGFAVFTLLLWRLSRIGRRPKGFPPGPPTLPLIGNLHQMPKSLGHLQFEKWAREYGPVFSLILGTKVVIVLSSDFAVKDLLDKRSAIYSSRPEVYLGQEIVSGGLRPLFMEYGDAWRKVRRLAHGVLNVKVARSYVPYQDLENKIMLKGLVDAPNDFINHIRRYTTSLTTQMTFGYRTPTSDDPELVEMFHNFDELSELAGTQVAALLDLFPIARRLPDFLLPMRKRGRAVHVREKKLFMKHFLNARKQLSSGTAKPCCCIDLLRAQKQEGFSDDLACYMSGSLLQAGSETTAAILIGFFLAMVRFPDVARQAQAEIDRVCGDRLPDLNDFHDLTYVRGCMKESLRWMPAATLGVPHAVTRDDSYLGYHIPKGATVLFNVWGISNDPKRHPDPRNYDPSRWANDPQNSAQAALNADPTKRDHFVFGAGRRMCQGMHIADRSLFLAMSRTLWAFDFKRAIDEKTGQEIIPDENNVVDGLFMCPKPFAANIVPRSANKVARVEQEASEVMKLLDEGLQWKTVPDGLKWKDYEPLSDNEDYLDDVK